MEKDIKNISLSYVCEKNWNEMEQVAGGRFCDSCQHVVHDFTNQSDCHLKKLLSENKRVCGRFKGSQMKTEFLKYAAATMIAASGVAINSCNEDDIKPDIPQQHQSEEVRPAETDPALEEMHFAGIIFIEPDSLDTNEIPSEAKETNSESKEL